MSDPTMAKFRAKEITLEDGRRGRGDTLDIEIIGLVKDARYSQNKKDVPPVLFIPYKQDSGVGQIHFYVRVPADSRMLLRAIRGVA